MGRTFMIIAGEPSGDMLAAELVAALRDAAPGGGAPAFFGAGGPRMAAAGVDLAVDLTAHSVVGLWEVVKSYGRFRRLFRQLLALALEKKPDLIICVDFSGFNRRFAAAVRNHSGAGQNAAWRPRIVQYVSPQVWASRPGRARTMARDFDLVLCLFPFEPDWYARHAPAIKAKFVGHPIFDRYPVPNSPATEADEPQLLLLPGSRVAEIRRHLPSMLAAWRIIHARKPEMSAAMVLPDAQLQTLAERLGDCKDIQVQIGGLPERLARATVAIASTGTVTVECAYFGAPTVALYKTSWITYWIGRWLVTVPHLAMPNLLAGTEVYPEFIQRRATAENLAEAALRFINDAALRQQTRQRLADIISTLGAPGAAARAARAVWTLLTA